MNASTWARAAVVAASLAPAVAGCSPTVRTIEHGTGGSAGTGGAASSTSTTSSGMACTPPATQACYDGPSGTENTGICKGGMRTCGPDGTFGACEGEVVPKTSFACDHTMDQDCDGKPDYCPLDYLSSQVYPATVGNNNVVRALTVDSSGNVLLAGGLDGSVDFGTGALGPTTSSSSDWDAFVLKLDPTGKTLWIDDWANGAQNDASAIATDAAGNVYVGGSYMNDLSLGPSPLPTSKGAKDAFVAQLDPSGHVQWTQAGGDATDQAVTAMAPLPSGGVAIGGTTGGPFALAGTTVGGMAGSTTSFVETLGSAGNGNVQVSTGFIAGTANLQQELTGLAVDPSGNVVVCGSFGGGMVFPGGVMRISTGGTDVWVMKIDGTSGNLVWAQTFGGAGDDRATGVAIDANGDIVLVGAFSGSMMVGTSALTTPGSVGFFVAHLAGGNGTPKSAVAYGSGGTVILNQMEAHVDSQGALLLTGSFDGTVDFGGGPLNADVPMGTIGTAVFLAKFDASGKHLASKAFGPAGLALLTGVTAAPGSNDVIVAGSTYFPIDLGSGMAAGQMMIASPIVATYAP